MKHKKLLMFTIGFFMITLLFSGCTEKTSFWNSLTSIKSSEISEFGLYVMPNHTRNAISRACFISDINTDNMYTHKGSKYSYSIAKIADKNKYLFLLYENNGTIVSSIYTDKFYNQNDFNDITYGTSFSTVEERLDITNTDSNNDDEMIFYLDTGEYYVIKLDDESNIEYIEKFNDEYQFMNILKSSQDFNISDLNA